MSEPSQPSDKPAKKPRQRATAAKAASPKDKGAASKAKEVAADTETKQPPRNDDVLREAVLEAALPQAAFDGFTDLALLKAGKEAGVD